MKGPYLEVTFRRGRPMAAYYYLPRRRGDRSYRTAQIQPGLVIDFNRTGRPIGIEITAPDRVSLATMNRVLTLATPKSSVRTWLPYVPRELLHGGHRA